MEKREVKEFYNKFLKSRMVGYRIYGNLRLDKAKAFILNEIENTNKVLDIGCGIGIVTESIANKTKRGYVWGIDLSSENIWYSNKTIKKTNISFAECDIINEFDKVKNLIDGKVDVITMIDVIEHIPKEKRQALFNNLYNILSAKAKLILTYPSPEYQRYLTNNNPSELQIIDNIIEINTLIEEASIGGFFLKYLSSQSIWRYNDYVHVVLQKSENLDLSEEIINKRINSLEKLRLKIKRIFIIPFLKKKYITDVFK